MPPDARRPCAGLRTPSPPTRNPTSPHPSLPSPPSPMLSSGALPLGKPPGRQGPVPCRPPERSTSGQRRQHERSTAGSVKAVGDEGTGGGRVAHPPGETASLFTGGWVLVARPTRALRSASLPAKDWARVFRCGGGGASHRLTRKGGGRSCIGRRN